MNVKEQYWKYSLVTIIVVLGTILFVEFIPFLGGILGACTIYILVRKQMLYLTSNDIEQATKLARAMITRYGMSDEFGMVAMETVENAYLGGDTSLSCSAETQARIDALVVSIVKEQYQKATQILTDNRAKLDELAKYLYEKETITGEEFMNILNKKEA